MPRSTIAPRLSRYRTGARLLTVALSGQAMVQALGLLASLLLLRWLNVTDFGQYTLAFAVIGVASTLIDLGVGSAIISLVGEDRSPARIARYVAGAVHARLITSAVVLPLAGGTFWVLSADRGWPLETRLILLCLVLVGAYSQGLFRVYAVPLLLERRLSKYYGYQAAAGLARLILVPALFATGVLVAVTAVGLGVLALVAQGLIAKRSAEEVLAKAQGRPADASAEMFRLLLPLLPGLVFAAVQPQIVIFMAAVFGETQNLAEVGALSRLAQVMLVATAVNGVVLGPYFSGVQLERVPRRLGEVIAGAVAVASALSAAAILAPQWFGAILGGSYADLGPAISLAVVASALHYVANVVWIVNSSRRWIYWWTTMTGILLTILVQVGCMVILDLSSTINLMWFGVAVAAASVVGQTITTVYSLPLSRRGGRDPSGLKSRA